jgi:predicted ABC-type ATPase
MLVVAGPSGSGKSSVFSLYRHPDIDSFNVDDVSAQLNGGSYLHIPEIVRRQATRECEAFIQRHIQEQKSFAVETTLRTDISIRQAEAAAQRGFTTMATYIATEDPEINVERVRERGLRGGHSAPRERVLEIYTASLAHFGALLRTFHLTYVWDNSADRRMPFLILECAEGTITIHAERIPSWVTRALAGTEFETALHP